MNSDSENECLIEREVRMKNFHPLKGSKIEKCEQGRDKKIYRSVAFTRRSTKICGKVVWVKRPILFTPFFGKVMVHKFKSVYVPKPDISVDESLIAYKGRLSWKQYIPQKRARFGIKLFQLCESESDYIWNSLIYTRKGTAFNENYNDYGLSTKSVLTLIHELKGKGYCLSTDNFYTSPELAEILIGSKTDVCGTLRPNRKGLPVSLKVLQ
ncbi:piggyBac transposable element-derived protein 4 [Trichonephila clavipes]|nr:piggyBac transposable element-derived protein 4 [Trichonephila clavipes]